MQEDRQKPYYLRWLFVAFTHSFGISDLVGAIIGLIIYFVSEAFSTPTVDVNLWIVVGIFGGIVLVRLILAPCWIYREDGKEVSKVKQEKEELERKLDDRAKKKEIRQMLGSFMEECRELMTKCVNEKDPPEKETEDLISRLQSYLNDNLGDEYIARINSGAGITGFISTDVKHPSYWTQFNRWMVRLGQFIADFKD